LNISETRDLLEDFKDFVLKEADYSNEVDNMTTYGNISGSIDYLKVPKPVRSYCNRDAIVMDYLPSEKIGVVKHRLTNAERSALAYRIMDIFVTNLVQDGVVHGDPHEGNIGVFEDKIVLYDFGSIINIDAGLRNQMKQLIFELMTENIDGAVDVLKQMTVINVRDEQALRLYLEKYIQYFKTLDIKVFNFNDQENFKKLPVKIDGIIFRLIRAFGIIEGICKDLDPKFSYEKVFMKYVDMIFMDPTFVQYKVKSDVKLMMNSLMKMLD
jgi:predicted unusual protein kinase regulating ubiquinone biosynthesis (AarF/ABC1/UbiB family)